MVKEIKASVKETKASVKVAIRASLFRILIMATKASTLIKDSTKATKVIIRTKDGIQTKAKGGIRVLTQIQIKVLVQIKGSIKEIKASVKVTKVSTKVVKGSANSLNGKPNTVSIIRSI